MSIPHDIPDSEQLFDLLLGQAAPVPAPVRTPPPAPARDDTALSNFQQRLWLVQQMDTASTAYLMPFHLRLRGPLDRPALQRALQLLWRRHDALRTIYPVQGGLPRCARLPADTLELREFDFLGAPDRWREHYLTTVFGPMNLEKGPLVRASLYRLAPEEHLLLVDIHHLNGDGASLTVLQEELFATYAAYVRGQEPNLPPPGADYADFVQHQQIRTGRATEDLARHLRSLEDAPRQIDFLFDRPLPERFNYKGTGHTSVLQDLQPLHRAFAQGRTLGLSPFMVSLTALGAMIHRHTSQEILLIGTPLSVRDQPRFARTVGFFVNTCVARLDFAGDPTLAEAMQRTRASISEMLQHPEVQLDELVNALCRQRPTDRPPLVQATLSFLSEESGPAPELPGGLRVEPINITRDSAMFELTLDLILRENHALCYLECYRGGFTQESARRFFVHFQQILASIASDPHTRVSAIPLFDQKAIAACRASLTGTAIDLSPATLDSLVRQHALRTPAAPALVSGDDVLSFGELAQAISARRGQLAAAGLVPGAVLALACAPGLDWVVTSLAALECGAAVLPLDADAPAARLRGILENSGSALLWHDDRLSAEKLAALPACLRLTRAAPSAPAIDAPSLATPERTAYLIYTSGTTGQPKGVRVSHAAIAAHVRSAATAYGYTPADRTLAFAPTHFDAFWEQLFTPLCAGASVLLRESDLWAPDELFRRAQRHAVTVLDLPPQYLREAIFFLKTNPGAAPDQLRLVIAGGEALPSALASEWQTGPLGELPLLNAYGPTEAVVTATVHRIGKGTRTATANGVAPIGFPLPGRELRLLDPQGREVGEGIAGELYLGGIALADGYHGDDARTAERFRHWVRNAAGGRFCEPGERGSLRLYRTGDRARIGPDGALEFLGRLDQQLKIRGFRIEPGEIESVLTRHPSVAQAFVTALEDPATGPQLVAYILTRNGAVIATTELADWLARWLPEAMRPAALVPVDRFPTTASGKIDATQLPRPALGHTPAPAAASRPPAGELEARIASIWGDVLGRRDIGATDNFFDLGGHSLLLVRVHTRLVAELGTPVRLVDLFANPTIAQQARLLRGDDRTASRRRHRTLRGDIAVVGMAGRFPGADNIDELWQNLAAGRESIRFFTQEELSEAGIPESLRTNPHYVSAHGFLGGEECFDAAFFGYTPHEAALIDPQQRLFLEECWHTLESAGCDPDRYTGDIGVYGGMGISLYLIHNLAHLLREDRGTEAFAASLGADKDFIASRVCYKLNLRGPGVNINTACSTSLVAIHTAAQALLNGECDMALAGGVTLSQPAKSGYLFEPGGIASPDGHCRAFADDATGTVGGSGCAVVCLMRLEDALAGGHPIRAVLKGSAINNDGSDKVGFTAPGVRRQRDVIRAALDHAGLSARDIQMIEAHGTGTPMGDPIEVQALGDAFADDEVAPQSCWIGSLKTNIGHLDTAAGAASFIKAVLSLEHGLIPASLHCATPSAKIDFPRTPFRVAQSTIPWPAGRRRAAVSSFGMGGTNAHAVLEEAPARPQSAARGRWCLPLSARSESALLAQARALAAWLGAHPDADPADVLRTLVAGRRRFAVRAVVFADRCEDATQRLDQLQPADLLRCDREGRVLSGSGLAGAMPDEFAELCREWLTGDLAKATAALPAGAHLVPLPGYAFERTRHWIDAQPTHGAAAPATAATANTPARLPLENWLHYPAWEDLPRLRETVEDLPALAIVTHGGESTAHWLDRSRAAGLAGSVYGSSEALERAAQAGTLPAHVLHLGALETTGSVASRLARLLTDVRALAASGGKRTLTLLHPGLEDDPTLAYLDAARAVVPHEYPSLTVRVLWVPLEPGVADFRAIQATALVETDDRHLAIRAGRRQRFIHAALPGLTAAAGAARLRTGGVYVITGGLGGIGLTLARELATRCQPRLFLFARHEPGAEETAALHDLETRGARVTTTVLDVADASAVKTFLAKIRATEGRIDGVIHAAGVGGGSLIARTGEAEIVPVLRAKIDGTRALAEALGDAPVDFVALCSSLTAVLGGPGQIAYAAANAWMDAFAQARAAAGQPWFSIRWDTWAEVGMAARPFVAEVTGRTLREWTVSPATYWPWGEHRIDGRATLPGTAYLELFALALGGQTQASFAETTLIDPLIHDGEATRTLRVIENAGELSFVSGNGAQQRVHARARRAGSGATPAAEPLETIRQRCTQPVARLSESTPTIAIEASPRWQLDARCLCGRNEALLELALDERYASDLAEHPWHPALLDVALSFYIDLVDGGTATLPWRYDSVQFFAPLARRIVSHARLVSHSERALVLDLAVYSLSGQPLAIVKGLTLVRATGPAARTPARPTSAPANPFALTPEEGSEVFLRALASAEPVVEVCTTEWRFAERITTPVTAAAPAATPTDAPPAGRQPRPESAGTYIAPASRAQQIVAQAWAEVLGYDRIGAEDDLIDLEADSLIALQASAQLEKLTGRKMPMAKFFEKPTVAHIAKAYADLLPETVTPAAPSQWEEGEL